MRDENTVSEINLFARRSGVLPDCNYAADDCLLTELSYFIQRKFLFSLVKEVADEDNGEAARQMAAVICKNLIANRT